MEGVAGGVAVSEAPEVLPVEVSIGDLARRAARDEGAFRELYERLKRPLYSFIYRMVGHMGESEELMQETLLKIYRNLGRLDDRDSVLSWCYSIARNTAISHLRKRRAPVESLEDGDVPSVQPRGHEEKEVEADLQRILLRLPPRYRAVFIMGVLEQKEYREIARITGKSVSSVKIDIHRARQMVKEEWTSLRAGRKQ